MIIDVVSDYPVDIFERLDTAHEIYYRDEHFRDDDDDDVVEGRPLTIYEQYDSFVDYLYDDHYDLYEINDRVVNARTYVKSRHHNWYEVKMVPCDLFPTIKFLHDENTPYYWVKSFVDAEDYLYFPNMENSIRADLCRGWGINDDSCKFLLEKCQWTPLTLFTEGSPVRCAEIEAFLDGYIKPHSIVRKTNVYQSKISLLFRHPQDAATVKIMWG